MDKSPSHLLIGAVGGPNFGDEAIMFAWIDAIRHLQPNVALWCDGYNNSNVQTALEGRCATSLALEESLWNFVYTELDEHMIWCPSSAYSTNQLSMLDHIAKYLREKNVRTLHLMGGGYLNSLWRKNYLLLTVAIWLADKIGARVIATGQGLTPIESEDASHLKTTLRRLDYIDVRDRPSWRLVQELGMKASRSGDDARLTFGMGNPPIERTEQPELILCLQNHLFNGTDAGNQLLTPDLCQYMESQGISQLSIIEAMEGDFACLTSRQIDLLSQHGISWRCIDKDRLLSSGLPFHKDSIAITSRYHPHLFLALCGMRGYAVASNNYYRVKHRSIRRYGSTWPIKDIVSTNIFTHTHHFPLLRRIKTRIAAIRKRRLAYEIYSR